MTSPDVTRRTSSSFYRVSSQDFQSRESLPLTEVNASCKLLLIGDANVGKTAMILSYCNELFTKRELHQINKRKMLDTKKYNSPSISRTPSAKILERNRLSDLKQPDKKRYSLSDIEDMSKRRSLIFTQCIDKGNKNDESDSSNELSLSNDKIQENCCDDHDIDNMNNDDYTDGDEIIIETRSTIGVDIKSRVINVDNRFFNCVFWDTAGQERFQNAIVPSLYKKSNGVILTYDICNLKSFKNTCTHWLREALKNLNSKDVSKVRFYLVGNKIDLYQKRQVNHEDVKDIISSIEQEHGITIYGNFEVSCKRPELVEKTFNLIILDLIENFCYECDNEQGLRSDIIVPTLADPSINSLSDSDSSDTSYYSDAFSKIDIPTSSQRPLKANVNTNGNANIIDITNPVSGLNPSHSASSCCT